MHGSFFGQKLQYENKFVAEPLWQLDLIIFMKPMQKFSTLFSVSTQNVGGLHSQKGIGPSGIARQSSQMGNRPYPGWGPRPPTL